MDKNYIEGGCFMIARQIFESEIFLDKPHSWFKIWIYLNGKVNHENNKRFKRGQAFFKYEWIADSCKVTKDLIKHCISYLKKAQMLATQKKTRGFIITIVKYNKYQNLDNYYLNLPPHSRHTAATHMYNKNGKNGKKYLKYSCIKDMYREFNNSKMKQKKRFLDFVFLTNEENKKLIKRFGKTKAEEWIEILNNGIGSKGYKYKSHYFAILSWARKKEREENKDWAKAESESIKKAYSNKSKEEICHKVKDLIKNIGD